MKEMFLTHPVIFSILAISTMLFVFALFESIVSKVFQYKAFKLGYEEVKELEQYED